MACTVKLRRHVTAPFDGMVIDIQKIDNGYLVAGTFFVKTKKQLIKFVTSVVEEGMT